MVVVDDINKLQKNLFLYRSFLFHFTKFETNSKNADIKMIVEALNIKNRKKRITFVIEKTCDYLDNLSKGCNLCEFINGKCICHRTKNLDYQNGCCRKCKYQSDHGCTTKNVACKLFTCGLVKNRKIITLKDVPISYVLTPLQRLTLCSDYYSSVEKVTKDLYYGPLYFFLTFH